MPQYTAIGLAAVFALVGFLPLAGRNTRRPLLWVVLIAGSALGYFAREGTQMALDVLGPYFETGPSALGAVVTTLVAVTVGELLKATPALMAVSIGSTDELAGLAYGAGAGAGFGAYVTWPLLAFPLGLLGSPLTSPFFVGLAIFGWFFRILAHVVTTAYVARAGVRGGLGGALFAAVIAQFVIGLAERMPVVSSISTGILVSAVISLAMFAYLWSVRSRAADAAGL